MKTAGQWLIILCLALSVAAGGAILWQQAHTIAENKAFLSDIKKAATVIRTRLSAYASADAHVLDFTSQSADLLSAPWMQNGRVNVFYYPKAVGVFAMRTFVFAIHDVSRSACELWVPDLVRVKEQQKILAVKIGSVSASDVPNVLSRQTLAEVCRTQPTLIIVFQF